MNDTSGNIIAVAVAVFIIAAMLIGSALIGLVLWDWFLVPLGLPSISIAHMVGLTVVISWFFGQRNKSEKTSITDSVARILVLIVVGFIAHLLM